ncbi:MAG: hypothetical protein ACK56F_17100 [bacterium]
MTAYTALHAHQVAHTPGNRTLQRELQANSVLAESCGFILLHAHSWRCVRLHVYAAQWQQLQPLRIEACAAALRARA